MKTNARMLATIPATHWTKVSKQKLQNSMFLRKCAGSSNMTVDVSCWVYQYFHSLTRGPGSFVPSVSWGLMRSAIQLKESAWHEGFSRFSCAHMQKGTKNAACQAACWQQCLPGTTRKFHRLVERGPLRLEARNCLRVFWPRCI